MLAKLISLWRGERPRLSSGPVERLDANRQEVPVYPPPDKGLPMVGPDVLLEPHQKLIRRIAYTIGFNNEQFNELVMPVIVNFTNYVHLLPASQAHHHNAAGGLLHHSLETAFYAGQAAEGKVFAFGKTPVERKALEPRWHVAAALAGLLHDIGKPVSDVEVISDQGQAWSPFRHSLTGWGREHQVQRYFVRWRENRHKKHEFMSAAIVQDVLTPEIKAWLTEYGSDVFKSMLDAISNQANEEVLYQLMVAADSASVEKDVRINNTFKSAQPVGIPVERYVMDAMRRLLSEGKWKLNEPGARVWVSYDGAFVAWAKAAGEILEVLKEDGMHGIPKSPESLADILIETGLASGKANSEKGFEDRYWMVAPEMLKRKRKGDAENYVWLRCLKLRNLELLVDDDLPEPTHLVIQGMEQVGSEGEHPIPVDAELNSPAAKEAAERMFSDQGPAGAQPVAETSAPATPEPPPLSAEEPPPISDGDFGEVVEESEPGFPVQGSSAGSPSEADTGSAGQAASAPSEKDGAEDDFERQAAAMGISEGAKQFAELPLPDEEGKAAAESNGKRASKSAQKKGGPGKGGKGKPGAGEDAVVSSATPEMLAARKEIKEVAGDFGELVCKIAKDVDRGVLRFADVFRVHNSVFYLSYPDIIRPYCKPADAVKMLGSIGWLVPDSVNSARKAQELGNGDRGLVIDREHEPLVRRVFGAEIGGAKGGQAQKQLDMMNDLRERFRRRDKHVCEGLPGADFRDDAVFFKRVGLSWLAGRLGCLPKDLMKGIEAAPYVEILDSGFVKMDLGHV